MKSNLYMILLLLIIFSLSRSQEVGWITVKSQPSGSLVHIDSILIGTTPIDALALTSGAHVVRISPPATGIWVLTDKIVRVNINSGDTTRVQVVFDKPVPVNSVPYGADVLVDSSFIGTTPLYLSYQIYKNKLLRLEKIGYVPYEIRMTSRKPILARLKPGENYFEEQPTRPPILGILPREKLRSKFALLAFTVVSHWAAFYFKNIADRHYEKYLHTANPKLIRENWNKTRKYDRLSDISLGMSYVSLTGLIYMVIWH